MKMLQKLLNGVMVVMVLALFVGCGDSLNQEEEAGPQGIQPGQTYTQNTSGVGASGIEQLLGKRQAGMFDGVAVENLQQPTTYNPNFIYPEQRLWHSRIGILNHDGQNVDPRSFTEMNPPQAGTTHIRITLINDQNHAERYVVEGSVWVLSDSLSIINDHTYGPLRKYETTGGTSLFDITFGEGGTTTGPRLGFGMQAGRIVGHGKVLITGSFGKHILRF